MVYGPHYWQLMVPSFTNDAGKIPVFPLNRPSNQSWLTGVCEEKANTQLWHRHQPKTLTEFKYCES